MSANDLMAALIAGVAEFQGLLLFLCAVGVALRVGGFALRLLSRAVR